MLFTAAAITVAIVGVAGVRALMRDDASSPAAHEAGWDAVAVVARTGGDITLVSPQGTIVGEYEKLGRAAQVEVAGSHLALIGSTSVTLLDLAAETDTEPTVVPIERGATVTRLATNSAHLLLAAGRPAGGEVTLIDGITGWSANLGELGGLRAPRLFVDTIRTDPTGDTIAIADAASFQTIVVDRPDNPDDPDAQPVVTNYAAQPLAIGRGVVVTSQVVGQRANIAVYTAPEATSLPVPSDIPVGGVVADGALVAVTTDGTVIRIRRGDRTPRQLTQLELPVGSTVLEVHPMLDATRLLVRADGYSAVIDTDGTVLYQSAHGLVDDAPTPTFGQRCIVAGQGGRRATLVDALDGIELAEIDDVDLLGASADGCTLVIADGDALTTLPGELDREVAAGDVLAVAPDAAAVVVRNDLDRTYLEPLDGDDEPVELTVLADNPATEFVFVER